MRATTTEISLYLAAAVLLLAPAISSASAEGVPKDPAAKVGREEPEAPAEPTQGETWAETITVTATRGPRTIQQVPATVTVLTAAEIESQLATNAADLVRYEPGVYVEPSSAGTGLGGFNIRGVGGNRVLTRIDGVPTAEEFEFGHFQVAQMSLDADALSSVEILRGAASSLYGSDALGGVVSFATKDPEDYLGGNGKGWFTGAQLLWDGRDDEIAGTATAAGRSERWGGSLNLTLRQGSELATTGTVGGVGAARTVADPQDWSSGSLLGKLTLVPGPASRLELALEHLEGTAETQALSLQDRVDLGAIFGFPPSVVWVVDKPTVEAVEERDRWRLSLEESLVAKPFDLDQVLWRVWGQSSETVQRQEEIRTLTQGGGPFGPIATTTIVREGLLTFEQDGLGGEVQGRQMLGDDGSRHLLTFGVTVSSDTFDQLRDRTETDLDTGEPVTAEDDLAFPTKYFPRSRVVEAGIYAQAELALADGRLSLVPGLRWDLYRLDADQDDPIYLSGNEGTLLPVDLDESALSPKLGLIYRLGPVWNLRAQYAHGFRAPPFSAVNTGFTHLAGGLTRLPNPDLSPETSDGIELGARAGWRKGSFGIVGFYTDYTDFIELVVLGFNPVTGLLEFQHRNVRDARISGVEARGDARLGDRWWLRGGLAWLRGEDLVSERPLSSVPPPQLNLGLRRTSAAGRWSGEIATTFVARQRVDTTADREIDQFQPPAYALVDLYGTLELTRRFTLQAGVLNLFDSKHWNWPNVIGREEDSPGLDRYTGPGVHVTAAVRYRF